MSSKRKIKSEANTAKKSLKTEPSTSKPVSSFFPDYQAMWRQTKAFQDPAALPQIVDVIGSTMDDFARNRTPYDQHEMNMLLCSVLRLMVDPTPDLGNDNNGFEKRHCKTYQRKTAGYNLLPFNPRCPLTENPEDEQDNSVQSDSKPVMDFELPFFMLTKEDVDKLEHKLPGLRSRIHEDSQRPTIHTKEHKFVEASPSLEKSCCSLCLQKGKMVVSFKCHPLCNVCSYSRLVRGFLCCPVVGCPTTVNLAQLGSIYAFLRRSINDASRSSASDSASRNTPPVMTEADRKPVTVKQEKV